MFARFPLCFAAISTSLTLFQANVGAQLNAAAEQARLESWRLYRAGPELRADGSLCWNYVEGRLNSLFIILGWHVPCEDTPPSLFRNDCGRPVCGHQVLPTYIANNGTTTRAQMRLLDC